MALYHRLLLSSATIFSVTFANISASAAAPTLANAQSKIAAMSVPFVPNAGQWNSRAAFAAHTFAGTVFVTTSGEIVYSLPGKFVYNNDETSAVDSGRAKRVSSRSQQRMVDDPEATGARTPGWALRETLVNAAGTPRKMSQSTLHAPAGYRPVDGNVSFIIGNDKSRHAHNVSTYERVNLGDMYPGVNVQLRATGSNVEKIFTVAPNSDPARIRIKIAGATQVEIGTQGELIVGTDNGPVSFTAPIAYQETPSGVRIAVQVSYVLDTTRSTYSFAVGSYDRRQPLVIDPLLQSTYVGGTDTDGIGAIAIHPVTGEVYVAGSSNSADFPGTAGGAQSVNTNTISGTIAVMARFNAALTTRIQSTYFGGSAFTYASHIAIHPSTGDIYVAGKAVSNDLPGVTGGAQSTFGGTNNVDDGFLARFNAALTTLVQATYVAGQGYDGINGLAIHPSTGDIYVAGWTDWRMWDDQIGVGGGAQSAYGGGLADGYVMRYNAALTARLQSSYVGGTEYDSVTALAIHPTTGDVYLAGSTNSANFPSTAGGAQSNFASSSFTGGFVTKFNAALTTRHQSTFHGGVTGLEIQAIAIHPTTGDVYVAGETSSSDLPNAAGGAQSTYGGGYADAFVTRFNGSLTSRMQSTYFGGSGEDIAYALTIHPTTGEVYVAGKTASIDLPLVAGGAQSSFANAYVTRMSPLLTSVSQTSYVGDIGNYYHVYGLAIHPISGEVYAAGSIDGLPEQPNFAGGAQSAYGGGFSDGLITRITRDLAGVPVAPPVIPAVQPVPTLSTHAMGLLILLLLWIASPLGQQRQRFAVNCWGGER